jgi:hypothetical protein
VFPSTSYAIIRIEWAPKDIFFVFQFLASATLVDDFYLAGKYHVHELAGIFLLDDDFVLVEPFFS